MAVVTAAGADCVVALGGGSTIGLGKAIALRTDMPQVVIPTTYAGSEATPIIGQTEGGVKTTQRTLKVLPEAIVYDIALTMTLPASLAATSGMNAIAHAAEGLYAKDANPIIGMIAEDGVRVVGEVENIGPGITRNLVVRIKPGTYGAAGDRRRLAGQGCPFGRPLRCMGLRHDARRSRHGPAPQALPHPGRHL